MLITLVLIFVMILVVGEATTTATSEVVYAHDKCVLRN